MRVLASLALMLGFYHWIKGRVKGVGGVKITAVGLNCGQCLGSDTEG